MVKENLQKLKQKELVVLDLSSFGKATEINSIKPKVVAKDAATPDTVFIGNEYNIVTKTEKKTFSKNSCCSQKGYYVFLLLRNQQQQCQNFKHPKT